MESNQEKRVGAVDLLLSPASAGIFFLLALLYGFTQDYPSTQAQPISIETPTAIAPVVEDSVDLKINIENP